MRPTVGNMLRAGRLATFADVLALLIEQDVAMDEAVGLAARARSLGMELMACESAPTMAAVERIIAGGLHAAINVKLCRSGGFFRSLEIVQRLRTAGLRFQIGCTLGESGLLSAAERPAAMGCAANASTVAVRSEADIPLPETSATSTTHSRPPCRSTTW